QQLKEETIDMVIKGFDQNQLDPEFADQVMKRIGVVGAEIGDENGNLWLSTEDNQRFIIRMPRSEIQSIVEGQMPGILEHRKSMALVTDPDEFPKDKEEDVFCFLDSLLKAFSLSLTGVILDAKEGTTLARAVVEGGGASKTLPLKTRDAIALAGRMQAPLYATTRILDGVSFGEGIDPVPKQDALNAIETVDEQATWTRLLRQAIEKGAPQIRVTPTDDGAEIHFGNTTETLTSETYGNLRNFLNGLLEQGQSTLYSRMNNRQFRLNIATSTTAEKPHSAFTVEIHLESK
ncbi:MAG: DUF151 domain-containing protein, partial [bacterium]|nr:DUF151 domain-containing protein [bacterium]